MESLQLDRKTIEILAMIQKAKDEQQVLDHIADLTAILIEKNYPYMPGIIKQLKKTNEAMNGNGIVHIELKLFKGEVQEAVFHEITKIKF